MKLGRREVLRNGAAVVAMALSSRPTAAGGATATAATQGGSDVRLRIGLSSIFVEDQDEALAFYTKVLGFVKKHDVPLGEFKWLTVVSPEEPDGTELLLEPNDNPAAKTFQAALFAQGIPINAFEVEDLGRAHETLARAGVRFQMPPTDMGTTRVAVLDDTCGNLVQIYEVVEGGAPQPGEVPGEVKVERSMAAPPHVIYDAWTTERFEWFAAPGTIVMKAEEGRPWYFEAQHAGKRHPHYGRFLKLVPNRRIETTWMNEEGTRGAETLLVIELAPEGAGTRLVLTHAGFADRAARDGHAEAWPEGLAVLDAAFPSGSS